MMNKNDRIKLTNAAQTLLQIKGLTATQEKQMDALKEVIAGICDANIADFENGILAIEGVGTIKIVANPPGLKMIATGKVLNEIELTGLIAILGEEYRKPAANVTRIRDEIAKGNKKVIAALKKHKVELIQEERYDVKRA